MEADLVERILAPLLENACRFAEQIVCVSVEHDEAAVLITVEDDGPGVPATERDAIFEPGRRGPASRSSAVATQGAGLGLPLARRLARSAGGDVVTVDSEAGARFVARLPRATPRDRN